jgi:virginiamycin A acetyltransferase
MKTKRIPSHRSDSIPIERLNPEYRSCCDRVAPLLVAAYRIRLLRPVVRWILDRYDGGFMLSRVWRRIFREMHGVELGALSRGAGLKPGLLPKGSVIGNFSCFGTGFQILRRNHTFMRFSQHPMFFNKFLGWVAYDTIDEVHQNPLHIGSDVWCGLNVTICPGCREIGDGAILGARSVVTRDVPPFTIVAGNPARIIRKRYSPEVEAVVAASKWWRRPLPEIMEHFDLFTNDIDEASLAAFKAAFPPA